MMLLKVFSFTKQKPTLIIGSAYLFELDHRCLIVLPQPLNLPISDTMFVNPPYTLSGNSVVLRIVNGCVASIADKDVVVF